MGDCRLCGGTPAQNGSIYLNVEGFYCNACSDAEIEAADQNYIAALEMDNTSPSGNIGAAAAWLAGKGDWLEAKGKGKGNDKGKDKDNSKGKARSRSPHRFDDMTQ